MHQYIRPLIRSSVSICMPTRLHIYLSLCLLLVIIYTCLYMSAFTYVCLTQNVNIYLSLSIYVYMSLNLYVFCYCMSQSMHFSICLSQSLTASISVCSSLCLSLTIYACLSPSPVSQYPPTSARVYLLSACITFAITFTQIWQRLGRNTFTSKLAMFGNMLLLSCLI